MKEKVELKGIILSSSPVRDYDKRLVILTKERGKITAFANGARKMNSSFSGITEPFNFGTFALFEGYDAYRFVGGEVKEYFRDLKNDIEGICYGTYFGEILEYLCVEGIGDTNVINLIYASLKALEAKKLKPLLIRRIFELKMLALDGEMMSAFSCAKCGNDKLISYSNNSDGLLCDKCTKSASDAKLINETTVYTIQYVLSSAINKLYTFDLSDDILREFDTVVGWYFEKHVDKKFKSLEILNSLS
ncbi:MAG: DNA repair protein RecO [Lachnospiraceae bacterium]|jgi:DNA repair protein RecO (recombination protein O)|nr:DNA repair protein RecO [Lachnospiraceae bacterium]